MRMNYIFAAHTDVGIRKSTNQDSVLIMTAESDFGPICMGVICDGMGGLANGELASATLIRAFQVWFRTELPKLLVQGFSQDELRIQWNDLIHRESRRIADHGGRHHMRMGTTVAALLLMPGQYHIVNVGDSRVYLLDQALHQLTKDQTFVQREMELGRMTGEEAARHPQRNVLLQCVGASDTIEPDFFSGPIGQKVSFLLCTDGFRHVLSPEEIYQRFAPGLLCSEQMIRENEIYLTELNKSRMENDNISVAVIKICGEGPICSR